MGNEAPGSRSKLNRGSGGRYDKSAIRVWRPTDWGMIDGGTHPARRPLKLRPSPDIIDRAEKGIDRYQAKGMDNVDLCSGAVWW